MPDKKKILICDDEEGIRESLKLILKDKYDLILTCNGEECLKYLENNKDIGVVLMDIKMPRFNGLEITKEIKRLYPHIKVLVETGYKSAEIAQQATSVGADDYIVKPFDSKEILKKVSAFV